MPKIGAILRCEVIYRIVVNEKDDLDMTRAEAVRVRNMITQLLQQRSLVYHKQKRRVNRNR